MSGCAKRIWAARQPERNDRMDDLYSLHGKNAVVTGAGAGIGRAIALAFARAGANVACVDLDGRAAEATGLEVANMGRRAVAIACDVGKEDDVKAAANQVLREFASVHV